MLLNAHTATRVYRECQFDILALLTGLSSICPLEGDSSGVIEIKWADGSVDMVPTSALIKAIVGNYYKKLTVGGSPITVTNGQLVLENIAAYVESMGTKDDDLEFFRSTIASLTVDTATLAPDTKIHRLDVSSLHAKSGTSTVTSVRNNGYADRVLVDSLDLSNIVMTTPISWGPLGFDASTITVPGLRSVPEQTPFMDGILLTGKPRFSSVYTDLNVLSLDPHNTSIGVEIPSITDDTLSLDVGYAHTTTTRVPSNLQEPFADNSPISLAMLYPKKYVRIMRDNTVVVRLQAADTSENDRIVRVYNKSGESIRACNAWIFVTNLVPATPLRRKSGTIVPVNYVDIPAHSSIDFLFSSEYLSKAMSCAFMFPMKYLGAPHE